MKLERICDVSPFSTDMNNETLIYTEKDGSIKVYGGKAVTPDANKKFVKFYPPDCEVFTTTDDNGLKVWNTQEMSLLYSYNKEQLYSHSYSNKCIIASFDDFNVKFYDLRARFMINSKPFHTVRKLDWYGDVLLCLASNTLTLIDFRNFLHNIASIEGVQDFAVCDGRFYYTARDKTLVSCNMNKDNKIQKLQKQVPYDRILSTNNKNTLVGLLENCIRVENFDNYHDISLGKIEPQAVHISNKKAIVVTRSALYKVDNFDVENTDNEK
ncbi:hypothetical protein GINT2_000210 [Glugoides intestinalis]